MQLCWSCSKAEELRLSEPWASACLASSKDEPLVSNRFQMVHSGSLYQPSHNATLMFLIVIRMKDQFVFCLYFKSSPHMMKEEWRVELKRVWQDHEQSKEEGLMLLQKHRWTYPLFCSIQSFIVVTQMKVRGNRSRFRDVHWAISILPDTAAGISSSRVMTQPRCVKCRARKALKTCNTSYGNCTENTLKGNYAQLHICYSSKSISISWSKDKETLLDLFQFFFLFYFDDYWSWFLRTRVTCRATNNVDEP